MTGRASLGSLRVLGAAAAGISPQLLPARLKVENL